MKIGSVLFTFFKPEDREKIGEKMPKVLDTISNLGYRGVEGLQRDLMPMLSGRNLELITIGGFPRDEEVQEVAKFSSSRGVKTIVTGPSNAHARDIWHHGYTEKSLEEETRRLSDMGKKCRDYDIDLCIHLEGKAIQSIDRLLESTDPEYVNLCLDTGWMMAGSRDPITVIMRYVDRIKHVHLKDWRKTLVNVGLDAPLLGEFCELGTGQIDHPKIFKTLRDAGYDGWYVVETPVYHNRDVGRAPSPEESAKINLEYLKKFL